MIDIRRMMLLLLRQKLRIMNELVVLVGVIAGDVRSDKVTLVPTLKLSVTGMVVTNTNTNSSSKRQIVQL